MTCRQMKIEPRRYLRDTLRRILDGVRDLSVLLPENYVPLATTPR